MGIELVTAYTGTNHVSSSQDGALYAGIVGLDNYVFTTGQQLQATMEDANTLVVASGNGLINGRHFEVTGTVSFTIPTGSQDMMVSNLAVIRYTKGSDSVESVTPLVLTGEPVAENPQDPEYNEGSILDGVSTVDFPIYRVVTTGISAGDPVQLFEVVRPLASYQDVRLVGHGTATFSGGCSGAVEVWAYDIGDGTLMVQAMCNANHGAYISFRAAGTYNAVALTLPEGYYVPGIYFDTPLFAQNNDLSAMVQISATGELRVFVSCSRAAGQYGMSSRCLMFRPGLDLGLRT